MKDCKPVPTPAPANTMLTSEDCPETEEEKEKFKEMAGRYRALVGALIFLSTRTRPDISRATTDACRFMSNPGPSHWRAAKRILRYLRGTTEHGITFTRPPDGKVTLTSYCDSDWANDPESRKSITGWVTFIAKGPISWASFMQSTVSLSSTDGEYKSASNLCRELMWLRRLLSELKHPQAPTVVCEDNQACIKRATNPGKPGAHKRSKHIDVQHHYVRECVQDKQITLQYVPTAGMIADMLTKHLGRHKFQKFAEELMGRS